MKWLAKIIERAGNTIWAVREIEFPNERSARLFAIVARREMRAELKRKRCSYTARA